MTQNYPDINAEFVIQTIGKGLGHAIWLTKEHWSDEDNLLIVFGDTIVEMDLGLMLSRRAQFCSCDEGR